MFWAQYPDRYTGETNADVHPRIEIMMQNHNRKSEELLISNLCNLEGVKIYQLPIAKGFDGGNG